MKKLCTKFEFTLTLVILTVLWVAIAYNLKKERVIMAVETYAGQEGITVDVESHADVLEAIDEMHSQTIRNLGYDDKMVIFLDKVIGQLHDEFDFEEDDDDDES